METSVDCFVSMEKDGTIMKLTNQSFVSGLVGNMV